MPMPWFLKLIIDRALGSSNLGLLCLLLGGILVIYILREIFFYISHYLFYYTGNRILFGVRVKLFKHLQSLSLRFYQEYRTGKLISNILTDVSMLNGMISTVLVNLVIHLFTITCIIIALIAMSPKLSLICLILVPLQTLNFTYFRRSMKKVAMNLRERMSEVSASLAETINGIKVVKSFGKERTESREFAEMLRPTFDASLSLNMKGVYTWMIAEGINITCIILALGWGGLMTVKGEMSIGDLVAYYTYLTMLTGPLNQLSGLSSAISDGMTASTASACCSTPFRRSRNQNRRANWNSQRANSNSRMSVSATLRINRFCGISPWKWSRDSKSRLSVRPVRASRQSPAC